VQATSKRRGRRPSGAHTKETILAAARAQFAVRGYSGASIRAIAQAAGVDPGSVRHHFQDKPALFAAAIELPVNPELFLARVLTSPPDELGEALATAFFAVWDTPAGHQRLRAILTTAPADPPTLRALAEFIGATVLGTVARTLDIDHPGQRVTLAGTQLVGIMVGRAVIGLEPLASMPASDVIAWIAPGLTRLLTGPAPPSRHCCPRRQ
jgi:AcrR family transcriptional regulator